MSEITNKDLFQAIKELSVDVKDIKVEIEDMKVEMKDMKSEIRLDIRQLNQKFNIVTKDLMEVRTDMSILQESNY